MSNSVFFQIGQCGNQVADAVWNSVKGRGLEAQCGAFSEGKVSSICVDLEPRVMARNGARVSADDLPLRFCAG